MEQKVFRTGKHQFTVTWEHKPSDRIKLDFTPIIKQFNLNNYKDCLLIHWQNRPKGLRRWGVFCLSQDQYYCTDYDKVTLPSTGCQLLQIPELQLRLPPSAVLCFPDCTATFKDNHLSCITSLSYSQPTQNGTT